MPNQYKPLHEELRPLVEDYWRMGLNDPVIADQVRDHIDEAKFGFSVKSLKRKRKDWGLESTRQQKQTTETISAAIQDIRQRFPNMGARTMVNVLRQDYGDIRVPEQVVAKYLKENEPEAVESRKPKR
ncbi:uncharacterized protein LAESUDRAFT_755968 [Laetiporus sulphureus 93-53]|uniref:Clr5 domain-containing protein n=1 Tax=Laetiporus sulphureus 93-53 TaxID=1314785 RepID=A0A165GKB3_9APHY|nr:uncharacterized protein LAESUDRAFT_755968 [Laetiporus sulphureus 93-53]KZT10471.1 hypothetical protein LAESUDRAFT_755968 [Laetiporus sulphureus 93-53]